MPRREHRLSRWASRRVPIWIDNTLAHFSKDAGKITRESPDGDVSDRISGLGLNLENLAGRRGTRSFTDQTSRHQGCHPARGNSPTGDRPIPETQPRGDSR
jgi:hypothetical protein